ncbi:MAG: hypothetical protein EPN48_11570 [Microbacteriaceae bacterium]|nr:MAG: hypothetical protein EPN48_11570 [Microbacteriaceae bacterium]
MTTFRERYYSGAPLLLPNAWDIGTALAFAAAGFPAVGTTSFGIAASADLDTRRKSSRRSSRFSTRGPLAAAASS